MRIVAKLGFCRLFERKCKRVGRIGVGRVGIGIRIGVGIGRVSIGRVSIGRIGVGIGRIGSKRGERQRSFQCCGFAG